MSKIEWLRDPVSGKPGYTVNPVRGLCPMDCKDNQGKSYCYARRMYKWFGWDETIRFDTSFLVPQPTAHIWKFFVGSTIELFGPWVKPEWLHQIFDWARDNPAHTFIFLTKNPEGLAKWSPFPPNCYVGVSATNSDMAIRGMIELDFIEASVKFLSIEPLLSNEGYTPWKYIDFSKVQWVIVGPQSPVRPSTNPRIEDVRTIVEAADKAGVPVFLKDNFIGLLSHEACNERFFTFIDQDKDGGKLRQEFPKV